VRFFEKIILGSVILSVVPLIVYFGFSTSADIPIQKDAIIQENIQDSANTELIKWKSGKLFDVFVDPKDFLIIDGIQIPMKATFELKPDLSDVYSEIGVHNEKIKPLVIIPIYTASAYSENGFYDFYSGKCDTCLTTKIVSFGELEETSSANGAKVLKLLGYDWITDVDLDKNPNIISKYDKIIILHNEYVTKKCLM
jgi:hypothetical protein